MVYWALVEPEPKQDASTPASSPAKCGELLQQSLPGNRPDEPGALLDPIDDVRETSNVG